jgi:hypothetical protein
MRAIRVCDRGIATLRESFLTAFADRVRNVCSAGHTLGDYCKGTREDFLDAR